MAPLQGRLLHAAIWTESLLAIMIFGYNSAAAGGVLEMPSFEKQFPSINVAGATSAKETHDKSNIQGTVVALYTLFGTFGALACTFLGDVRGRRMTLVIASSFNVIGVILMSTSYSLGQFIVGRIFIGLATGAITATVPAWQSELSRAASRGSHVSSFGIYCGSGLSLAQWIAFGFSFTTGQVTWRFPIAGSGILAIIVMSTVFLLPESPRWLKLKHRDEEARRILERLHPGDPEAVDQEIEEIDVALRMAANQESFKSIFTMGPQRIWHRVLLASVVQIMLQFTGVNAIAFYTPTIYRNSLGFPPVEASALAAASQACIILGGIICSFTVDRFGRRALMMVSGAGMAICLACVTGLASTKNPAALKAAVFFLYMYYIVYTLGFIGIPFLYASEVAPVQFRAAICGLSTAISWLFNFLVVEITPVGFADISYRYFIIYTVTCASFVPIVYYFYPETAGRSLEEIDAIFLNSKSAFDCVAVAQQVPHTSLADMPIQKVQQQVEEIKAERTEHNEVAAQG